VISISDCISDYVNPTDAAKRLNVLVYPEVGVHGALVVLAVLHAQWLFALLNVPLAVFHGMQHRAGTLRLDPTTLVMRAPAIQRARYWVLGLHLIAFFFAMFRMIYALINGNFD
jgi:hypothetical protein